MRESHGRLYLHEHRHIARLTYLSLFFISIARFGVLRRPRRETLLRQCFRSLYLQILRFNMESLIRPVQATLMDTRGITVVSKFYRDTAGESNLEQSYEEVLRARQSSLFPLRRPDWI